ncbi:histidinol-phosphatase [Streptantibioticus silvisoli]|uniref:Histidinol-phosphatase n=1 Tax=Streptantibioticus silvisoli TaxID=2705255 RepID=A0ABT6VZD2_9ACTN|nr:histidinol-phosphatase [Streptantibioticus silvisoli]MDI5963836.1 histidinol-phosphatase [Streptantibioticus silvisoli]
MTDFTDDLRLAHVLADAADAVTMERFKALDLKVETKPDLTPVSEADKAAEELIRAQLSRARPRDAVLGEEFGSQGASNRRWIIDPIDGTKNYVRGVPVWATLIALAVAGEGGTDGDDGVVGLVSAPALGRRWWASKGTGAFTGRSLTSASRMRVSGVDRLADASFSYSSLSGWQERGMLDGFLELTRSTWRTRAYGDFWSYMMVAEGSVDLAAEPDLSLWDMAAPSVVVREAGGRFTDLSGIPGPYGGNAAASNGLLHDDLLRQLAAGPARADGSAGATGAGGAGVGDTSDGAGAVHADGTAAEPVQG